MRPNNLHGSHCASAGLRLLAAAGLVAALAGPAAAATAIEIVPQTLFELRYGEAEDEIGISIPDPVEGQPVAPGSLVVSQSGEVYIADYVQGKVKSFDRNGNLLMVTEGKVENLGLPAISPTGEIVVAAGSGADQLVMFTADGRRISSLKDEDGMMIEPRGGDYIMAQIIEWMVAHGLYRRASVHPSFTYFDAQGRLFVGVRGGEFEPGVAGARQRVCVFSPALELAAVTFGEFADPQGRVYSPRAPWTKAMSRTFEVRGANGSLLREVNIPSMQTSAALLAWMGGRQPPGAAWKMADEMGNIYLIDGVSRASVGEAPFFLTERLWVASYVTVVKQDHDGSLLAAFRISAAPFTRCMEVCVGPVGDIYYFDFGPESLTVNLISADSLMAAAAAAPSKIVAVREPSPPEERSVMLRRALDAKGWRFSWEPAAARAVAVNGDARVEVVAGRDRAHINGRPVRLPRRAYISQGRIYVPRALIAEVIRSRGG